MAIAKAIKYALGGGSAIRKMFEEGSRLKKLYGADKVFDFSIGNPDIEPPQAFHDVLVKLATEDKKGTHGYMPNAGYVDVREALAKKVAREHNVPEITGGDLVMSVGAAGGLNAIFKAILNPGDEVIVARPYFMEYRSYVANFGGVLVEVDSADDFNLDVDAIAKALTDKTAAVLINSPHNPTGRIYPAETITALADLLNDHGKKCGRMPYLIADEPYREIVYGGRDVPAILSAYDNSLVVTSYSKSLSLPGERIGYVAVAPAMEDKADMLAALVFATRVLGFVNAPALMQRVVAELTEAAVDVEIYARRRDAFKSVLDEAGITYAEPEGAFYLFCKVPIAKNSSHSGDAAFVNHLKDHLILGVPGTSFGAPGWLRFAYCVDESIIRNSGKAFKTAMENW
ncbi:MAG: pyridoxal phosphate-dependent aminotransferase [Treponema sp.]|jgi:aspartate aminotransferase|nr:pyridoxal phosphate-dependent aminotransferase [Treponema sp.]